MNDINNLRVAVYEDASLGNLPDGGSQAGYLVFLVDSEGIVALIAWQSHKIRRVVRSTIASETLAMSDAMDAGILIASMWKELVGPQCNVIVEGITDCYSLFDAVNSTKLVSDKRLRIEMAMLRQMQERN